MASRNDHYTSFLSLLLLLTLAPWSYSSSPSFFFLLLLLLVCGTSKIILLTYCVNTQSIFSPSTKPVGLIILIKFYMTKRQDQLTCPLLNTVLKETAGVVSFSKNLWSVLFIISALFYYGNLFLER
jgi:hypothetical protein